MQQKSWNMYETILEHNNLLYNNLKMPKREIDEQKFRKIKEIDRESTQNNIHLKYGYHILLW